MRDSLPQGSDCGEMEAGMSIILNKRKNGEKNTVPSHLRLQEVTVSRAGRALSTALGICPPSPRRHKPLATENTILKARQKLSFK